MDENGMLTVDKLYQLADCCHANLRSFGWMGVNDAGIVAFQWWETSCKAWFLQHTHAHVVTLCQRQYHNTEWPLFLKVGMNRRITNLRALKGLFPV